jgi:hypothetical protein
MKLLINLLSLTDISVLPVFEKGQQRLQVGPSTLPANCHRWSLSIVLQGVDYNERAAIRIVCPPRVDLVTYVWPRSLFRLL